MRIKLRQLGHQLNCVTQDTWKQMNEAQLFLVASSLAYNTILSLIPLLAVSFAIFQAFGGLEKLYETVEPWILNNLASGSSEEAMQFLRKFVSNANAGAIGITGFVGLVATSMAMLSSIEKAINQVWRAEFRRPFFQRIVTYWFFITLGPLGIAVGLGALTSTSDASITRFLPSGSGTFLIGVAVLYAVYRYVPHRVVAWRPALVSAFVASVFLGIARWGYEIYTRKVVSYDKIYGSLGAVPILILWIYIIWLVVLTGAALCAALQKKVKAAT